MVVLDTDLLGILIAVASAASGGGVYLTKLQMYRSQPRLDKQQPEDLAIDKLRDKITWISEIKEDFTGELLQSSSKEERIVYQLLIEKLNIQIRTLERSLYSILEKQKGKR